MATPEQCPFYNDCGFVKWRKENPSLATPLPDNGDCGKNIDKCARLHSKCTFPPSMKKINPGDYGPQTSEEFDIGLPPKIKDSKGKLRHRIIGGVDK